MGIGEQPSDTGGRLPRSGRFVSAKVIDPGPRVGVDQAERPGLRGQGLQAQGQGGMLEKIGEIAGMEGVAIVHSAALDRGRPRRLRHPVRRRAADHRRGHRRRHPLRRHAAAASEHQPARAHAGQPVLRRLPGRPRSGLSRPAGRAPCPEDLTDPDDVAGPPAGAGVDAMRRPRTASTRPAASMGASRRTPPPFQDRIMPTDRCRGSVAR